MAINELRRLDLLNTLAVTLVNYSQENGGGVTVDPHPTDPGWTVIQIRSHFCQKCNRLSPDQAICQFCEPEDG